MKTLKSIWLKAEKLPAILDRQTDRQTACFSHRVAVLISPRQGIVGEIHSESLVMTRSVAAGVLHPAGTGNHERSPLQTKTNKQKSSHRLFSRTHIPSLLRRLIRGLFTQ